MTDVVKIAKKCRAKLVAEIAKLDEFIGMADKLIEYERQSGAAQPRNETAPSDGETSAPPPRSGAKAEPAANGAGTSA
jgi:hypothetical protein